MTFAADIVTTESPRTPLTVTPRDLDDRVRAFAQQDYRRVVATVALWCDSIDDAADAVADALGRTWERIDKGQSVENLAAFVTTCAMNAIRSKHRRDARFKRKQHLLTPTRASEAPSPERIDVVRALATLTPRQREIVALHYGADLTMAEVARHLDIAQGTVKATLHQARALLAEQLTKGDDHD